ncbi:hypothetical protein [Nocardiopsis sp. NPDC006938]|uniref:hypothetical protein n=1 Tax=Nocardiopsis sp. NPDC006938 TaxID=3364337 RepID=UPI0036C22098
MSTGRGRVRRCHVSLVREGGCQRRLGAHLAVPLVPGVPTRWLHAADVVVIVAGGGGGETLAGVRETGHAFAPLASLPGSRAAVDLGEEAAVYLRGVPGPLRLPDRPTAEAVAALACSWPKEWGGRDAVVAAVRAGAVSLLTRTEAGPVSTVSVRLGGTTARCRWSALR